MIKIKTSLIEAAYSCAYDFLAYEEYDTARGICIYLNRNSLNILTTPITLTKLTERPTLEELRKKKYKYCSIIGAYYMCDYPEEQPDLMRLHELHRQIEVRLSELEQECSFEKRGFESAFSNLYATFISGLSESERERLRCLQKAPLIEKRDVIDLLDREWNDLPQLNDYFTLWYVGDLNVDKNPYLLATYSKDIAAKHAGENMEKIHEICVIRNCRILPIFLFDEVDAKKEVILKVDCLEKKSDPIRENEYFLYR